MTPFGVRSVVVTPDGSVATPAYDEAGLLGSVAIRLRGAAAATTFVAETAHNARGQRERVRFGNGVTSTYTYDARSFRLARIESVLPGVAAAQDLRYTYDPVGNVAEVADAAQQSLIFAGVPVDPVLRFEYDALYRLVAAEGRELAGVDAQPAAIDILRSVVPSATAARRYRETYAYDPGGNITSMRHEGGAGWERRYAYAVGSNRISGTSLPGDPAAGPFSATYAHDARGNVTAMPHLASLAWDAKDRLTTVDLGGGGTVHYTYDSAGRRVRKVIQRVGSIVEETVYVAGWERFRRRNGAGLVAERETLHVSDGGQRIAIVETETRDAGGPIADPAPRIATSSITVSGPRRSRSTTRGGHQLRGVLPVRRYGVRRRARQALPVRWPRTRRRNGSLLLQCPVLRAVARSLDQRRPGRAGRRHEPLRLRPWQSRDLRRPDRHREPTRRVAEPGLRRPEGHRGGLEQPVQRAAGDRSGTGSRVRSAHSGTRCPARRVRHGIGWPAPQRRRGTGSRVPPARHGPGSRAPPLRPGAGRKARPRRPGNGRRGRRPRPGAGSAAAASSLLDLGDGSRQHGVELDEARGRSSVELDEGRCQHGLDLDQGSRRDRGPRAQDGRGMDLELGHRARDTRRHERARSRGARLPHRRPRRSGDPRRRRARHRRRPRLVDGVRRELRLEQAIELADVPRR